MVIPVLQWSLLVGSGLLALICATFAVASYVWCRPEAVRLLLAKVDALGMMVETSLKAAQQERAAAAVDLEQAGHERDLAQDYNKRSAARDNRARGVELQAGAGAENGGAQTGGRRFGH